MKSIYQATTIIGAAVLALVASPLSRACDLANTTSRYQLVPQNLTLPAQATAPTLDANGNPAMIGMWYVQFISQGNTGIPDGTVLDFGYAQWHSDFTEWYNSGGRAPSTQNFCEGVWKQAAAGSYQLNHFAFSYDQTSGTLENTVDIKESVTLASSGNSFTGTFAINSYDLSGNPAGKVTGTLSATRVTLESTVPIIPPM